MTDISRELLHAQAQAEVDRIVKEGEGKATLKLEFTMLESNFLARVCAHAALDMIQDEADATDDEQRKHVFMSRIILAGIANKFKAAATANSTTN